MTRAWSGEALAERIRVRLPEAVEGWDASAVWVRPERLLEVARLLKEEPGLEFNYLNAITAVDYIEYFEVIYQLTSFPHNHSATIKARVYGREGPELPSVTSLWQGADLQEREIWDLMGIRFTGHPNLKRVLLWEGFPGHPLRKDFTG